MIKNRERVHFLNLLYDHKDYTSFDNAFSIIMKNFPEPIRLQTNTSLEDGNKSEIPIWEMDILRLKKDGAKTVKNLIFRIADQSKSVILVLGRLRILEKVEAKYSFEKTSPSVGRI